MVVLCAFSCASNKNVFYVGQVNGYLGVSKTFGGPKATFTSTKDNLLSLMEEKDELIKNLPGDVFVNVENEIYKYKNTKGYVIYKRDQNFKWVKVTFVPLIYKIESVSLSKEEIISVRILKDTGTFEELRFVWRPETFSGSERYVSLK